MGSLHESSALIASLLLSACGPASVPPDERHSERHSEPPSERANETSVSVNEPEVHVGDGETRELSIDIGNSVAIEDGLHITVRNASYLHVSPGRNAHLCTLTVRSGSETREITLSRDGVPLQYEDVMGWRIAVVEVVAYGSSRARLSIQRAGTQ
jgi:hypothetical protein